MSGNKSSLIQQAFGDFIYKLASRGKAVQSGLGRSKGARWSWVRGGLGVSAPGIPEALLSCSEFTARKLFTVCKCLSSTPPISSHTLHLDSDFFFPRNFKIYIVPMFQETLFTIAET